MAIFADVADVVVAAAAVAGRYIIKLQLIFILTKLYSKSFPCLAQKG